MSLPHLAMEEEITSVDVKLGPHPEFGTPKPLFPVRVVQNAFGTDKEAMMPAAGTRPGVRNPVAARGRRDGGSHTNL
jgi:hypothetical protein